MSVTVINFVLGGFLLILVTAFIVILVVLSKQKKQATESKEGKQEVLSPQQVIAGYWTILKPKFFGVF